MGDLKSAQASLKVFRKPVKFTLSADEGWGQRLRLAAQDFTDGLKLRQLTWALAFSDIKLRYRGSAIGPFWLTISTGVQIAAMGFLYADLFHTDIHTYLPFLTVSIILWGYLSSLITNGCICFSGADVLIKGTRMPFLVHAVRSMLRDTIVFGHNLIVLVVVLVLVSKGLSFYMLVSLLGLLLWMINGVAVALCLGAICARFRDIPQIIGAVMQIAFFVTPVIWQPDVLKGNRLAELVVSLNPFVYLLDIVRNPLLGVPLTGVEIGRALLVSVVVVVGALFTFARVRGRIAFWV